MNYTLALLALLTGLLAGAAFRFVHVPIPAPPTLAGVMGIVGIFLGYKIVDHFDWGVDLLAMLGLS